jgi:hypothetical protein
MLWLIAWHSLCSGPSPVHSTPARQQMPLVRLGSSSFQKVGSLVKARENLGLVLQSASSVTNTTASRAWSRRNCDSARALLMARRMASSGDS